MVKYMRFTHTKVIEYILGKESLGYVATMRNYIRKPSEWIIVNLGKVKLPAQVLACLPATRENIEKFTEYSGFKSPEEWLEEAKKLHRGKKPRYIILLKIVWDESRLS